MQSVDKADPGQQAGELFREHRNAFGFLRLLFATLVIESHIPEIIDGNKSREILFRLFGTISFGDLAVDGFFMVSGYLIVKSFVDRPEVMPFLLKRVARIYPAFLMASLICVVVVAPLGGASLHDVTASLAVSIRRAVMLHPPEAGSVFVGTHYEALNGSLWTIAHEAHCYLLVLILGVFGVFRRPWITPTLAAGLFALLALASGTQLERLIGDLPVSRTGPGDVEKALLLTAMFLTGATFYLFRHRIAIRPWACGLTMIGLLLCLPLISWVDFGVAVFGGYLLFSFARWGSTGVLSHINNKNDISYGVYLYAWPIEKLIIAADPTMPIIAVGLLTLIFALICGALSWFLLEKPVIRKFRTPTKLARSAR